MTFTSFVLKWNNTWGFDYWWRKKYNVPFNSEAHRSISQIDIKFDYIENHLANKQYDEFQLSESNLKKYNETGEWIKERVDKSREDELFDKVNLEDF